MDKPARRQRRDITPEDVSAALRVGGSHVAAADLLGITVDALSCRANRLGLDARALFVEGARERVANMQQRLPSTVGPVQVLDDGNEVRMSLATYALLLDRANANYNAGGELDIQRLTAELERADRIIAALTRELEQRKA